MGLQSYHRDSDGRYAECIAAPVPLSSGLHYRVAGSDGWGDVTVRKSTGKVSWALKLLNPGSAPAGATQSPDGSEGILSFLGLGIDSLPASDVLREVLSRIDAGLLETRSPVLGDDISVDNDTTRTYTFSHTRRCVQAYA